MQFAARPAEWEGHKAGLTLWFPVIMTNDYGFSIVTMLATGICH
jgi:hypothetical protein